MLQVYQGEFFKDRCHGRGDYLWPNGFRFVGTFFMDKKEGYGRFTFTRHAIFEVILHICHQFITVTRFILFPKSLSNSIDSVCIVNYCMYVHTECIITSTN